MPAKIHPFNNRQTMRKNTFEVFRYRDDYLRDVALHHHDFYEIYLFLSGNVTYTIESRTYRLSPGDLLLMSPMELHQPMFPQGQQVYERIVLWISKSYWAQLEQWDPGISRCFDTSLPGHTNLLRPDSALWERLTGLLEDIIQDEQSSTGLGELYRSSCLSIFLILVNRLAMRTSSLPDSRPVSDSVVYDVLDYINAHYSENLSLDSLANQFYISKYHLSRIFNSVVGTSVYRYIIQKRLVMAKQMMSEGVSSTEVYQHCGFGDYSNFYRAFKAEYHMSPKAYMASLREGSVPARQLPGIQ